jgi:hypothetical protein
MVQLILENQRVYDFYQSHPQYDFESMSVLFVELLERLNENLSPSLTPNFANQLMHQMTQLQTELQQQQQQQQLDHYQQMQAFRTQYVEELKHIVHDNHTDKLQPLLTQQIEHFQQKLQLWQKGQSADQYRAMQEWLQQDLERIGQRTLSKDQWQEWVRALDDKLGASESRLQNGLREQQRTLDTLTKTQGDQDKMHTQVSELLRKMDNSSSKGKVSETVLGHVIHNLYPMGEVKAVGTTKETGDILMLREGKPTILFENKNYDRNVGQEEVQKFLRDVDTQKCCGILLAQNYGIANRANYEIHLYQGQVCLYLHSVQYDPEKIKAAVDIIDHLYQHVRQEADTPDKERSVTVEQSFLETLNKEYQHFVQQKLTQTKMVKDHCQKMLAQIDEMKCPQLEQWLGTFFSQSLAASELQCKYCGFEAKNPGGLNSHLRACKKRPRQPEPNSSKALKASKVSKTPKSSPPPIVVVPTTQPTT